MQPMWCVQVCVVSSMKTRWSRQCAAASSHMVTADVASVLSLLSDHMRRAWVALPRSTSGVAFFFCCICVAKRNLNFQVLQSPWLNFFFYIFNWYAIWGLHQYTVYFENIKSKDNLQMKVLWFSLVPFCVVNINAHWPPSVSVMSAWACSGTAALPGPQRGKTCRLEVQLRSWRSRCLRAPRPDPVGCWRWKHPRRALKAPPTPPPGSYPAAGTGSAPGTCFGGGRWRCSPACPLWWWGLEGCMLPKSCACHLKK